MNFFKDIRVLSKQLVRLEAEFETATEQRQKRLLRQAENRAKKLRTVLGKMFPLSTPAEIEDFAKKQIDWMQERMARRHGRRIQGTKGIV